MIKTLASCQFDLIGVILASFLPLCYRLSKLHTTERSAFVQAADITRCQIANRQKSWERYAFTSSQRRRNLPRLSPYRSHLGGGTAQLLLQCFRHDDFHCFFFKFTPIICKMIRIRNPLYD